KAMEPGVRNARQLTFCRTQGALTGALFLVETDCIWRAVHPDMTNLNTVQGFGFVCKRVSVFVAHGFIIFMGKPRHPEAVRSRRRHGGPRRPPAPPAVLLNASRSRSARPRACRWGAPISQAEAAESAPAIMCPRRRGPENRGSYDLQSRAGGRRPALCA